jgi:hypothetical protein
VTLRTTYDFVLPRGYVDEQGRLHREGTMRLATARDELEPLRDPTISGPDDPRLTILVLARVLQRLGTVEVLNSHVVEGLFAVDLAFLQDFYGVINFGTQEEYEALLEAQAGNLLVGEETSAARHASAPDEPAADSGSEPGPGAGASERRSLRSAVEELPRQAL